MSINARLEEAKEMIYGSELRGDKEWVMNNYFSVMEEEAKKDPFGAEGWLDLEDPADALGEAIYCNDEDVAYVEEVLDGYIRYCDIALRCIGKDVRNAKLEADAVAYLKRNGVIYERKK